MKRMPSYFFAACLQPLTCVRTLSLHLEQGDVPWVVVCRGGLELSFVLCWKVEGREVDAIIFLRCSPAMCAHIISASFGASTRTSFANLWQ
jgi:hypothetical protein